MSETLTTSFFVWPFMDWISKNINVYTFELSFPFEEGTTACFRRLVFAILAAGESCRCCQTIVMQFRHYFVVYIIVIQDRNGLLALDTFLMLLGITHFILSAFSVKFAKEGLVLSEVVSFILLSLNGYLYPTGKLSRLLIMWKIKKTDAHVFIRVWVGQ